MSLVFMWSRSWSPDRLYTSESVSAGLGNTRQSAGWRSCAIFKEDKDCWPQGRFSSTLILTYSLVSKFKIWNLELWFNNHAWRSISKIFPSDQLSYCFFVVVNSFLWNHSKWDIQQHAFSFFDIIPARPSAQPTPGFPTDPGRHG